MVISSQIWASNIFAIKVCGHSVWGLAFCHVSLSAATRNFSRYCKPPSPFSFFSLPLSLSHSLPRSTSLIKCRFIPELIHNTHRVIAALCFDAHALYAYIMKKRSSLVAMLVEEKEMKAITTLLEYKDLSASSTAPRSNSIAFQEKTTAAGDENCRNLPDREASYSANESR